MLVTIACLGLGWVNRGQQQRVAVAALRKSNPGAAVFYDFQVGADGNLLGQGKSGWLARCRNALGVDYFSPVVGINLSYGTEDDLECVAHFRGLKWLELERSIDVTDSGLEHLRGLRELKMLFLVQADRASDQGLQYIAELTNLERLSLDVGPRVTATGLQSLSRLTHLKQLDVATNSEGTLPAMQDLRRRMPLCDIGHWRVIDNSLWERWKAKG